MVRLGKAIGAGSGNERGRWSRNRRRNDLVRVQKVDTPIAKSPKRMNEIQKEKLLTNGRNGPLSVLSSPEEKNEKSNHK